MFILGVLVFLLALAIIFFVTYPKIKRNILPSKFNDYCSKKISKIAKKNNYLLIEKFNEQNFTQKDFKINHVLFGKKYIYLISDYCLIGSIEGEGSNQSWIFRNREDKSSSYIDNLNYASDENIRDFAGIFNAKSEIFIKINIVPNECNLFINSINKENSYVVQFSNLKSLISKIEGKNVSNLDEEELHKHFEIISSKNER